MMQRTKTAWHDADVEGALTGLRRSADEANVGWSPTRWRLVERQDKERKLDGLAALDPGAGEPITIKTTLDLPARLCGVNLVGDRLELTVTSIYPMSVAVGGREVIAESVPPVAAGPELVEVLNPIPPGWKEELEATLRPARGQGGTWGGWLGFTFTTPRLRRRFRLLDLAWAQLALASEVASTNAERDVVRAAARSIPEALPDSSDAELQVALDALASTLSPLAKKVASITVHVIGHTHIDLAWLWTWDDAREVIKRDVRTVLEMMRDYPEMTFTFSQPAAYEVIRQEEPRLFAELVQRVREGRWEPATLQWVEGDTNIVSSDSIAAQVREAVKFSLEYLGVQPTVFLAPDTFGHSANLPQIVSSAGGRVYYHARCNPGESTGRRWPAYWWEGIDGTRIFACSTESHGETLTAGAVARAAIEARRAGLAIGLLIVGIGNHGGGPGRHGYDTLREIALSPMMPSAACSTLARYAEAIINTEANLPTHQGETATIFEGCYTTHVNAKQANRDGERRIATAEALSALAGLAPDEEVEGAWRDLCFHQFHDILDGSAIPEAYEKTRLDHERIVKVTNRAVDRALPTLLRGSPPGSICVIDTHGRESVDVVSVHVPDLPDRPVLVDESGARIIGQRSGDQLLFVARAPAFGVARYLIDRAATPSRDEELSVRPDGGSSRVPRYWRVETPSLSATVRADSGILTSFIDKRTGRELVAFGMPRTSDYGDSARPDLALNVFQLADERPHAWSAWHYAEVHAEHSLIDGATTELIEDGPARIVLRVTHKFRASRVTEDIAFYRDISRVDFAIHVDWHEVANEHVGIPNLKLSFAPNIQVHDAWFEVPFAAVNRDANGQQVPALRWSAVSGQDSGIAVLNDSVHGHDVLGNRLRLTLIRTAYDPDTRSDQGQYVFRAALLPYVGDWRAAAVPAAAALFDRPLIVRYVGEDLSPELPAWPPWRPRVQTDGLISTALRGSSAGVVLRLTECAGRPTIAVVDGMPRTAMVWEADITERKRRLLNGPPIRIELRPWQVRTLLVLPGDGSGAGFEVRRAVHHFADGLGDLS